MNRCAHRRYEPIAGDAVRGLLRIRCKDCWRTRWVPALRCEDCADIKDGVSHLACAACKGRRMVRGKTAEQRAAWRKSLSCLGRIWFNVDVAALVPCENCQRELDAGATLETFDRGVCLAYSELWEAYADELAQTGPAPKTKASEEARRAAAAMQV